MLAGCAGMLFEDDGFRGVPPRLIDQEVFGIGSLRRGGAAPERAGDGRFDLLNFCQQLIQIRCDNGFSHEVNEVCRHPGEGFACELDYPVVNGGWRMLGVFVLHPHLRVNLLE